MPQTVQATAVEADQKTANFVHSYTIAVPSDNVVHPLNELAFGYFVAPDPARSDRALRSIAVRNIDGAFILFTGGNGISGLANSRLLPGEERTYAVNKLSSVGVRNNSGAEITIEVVIVAIDR